MPTLQEIELRASLERRDARIQELERELTVARLRDALTSRKIVIQDCGECPSSGHKGSFGAVSRIPVCRKADRELPWTPIANSAGHVSAKREPGIPDWCPLPKDANELAMASPPSARYVGPDAADEYRAAEPGINPEHESFVMFMRGWEVK